MNAWTPAPASPPADDAQTCGGEEEARLNRKLHLRMLNEMAQAGVELVQEITRQAPQRSPADLSFLAMAHSRATRAVRMNIALHDRLTAGRDDRQAAARKHSRIEAVDRRARVERIVARIATAEHDDEDTIERLVAETAERLYDGDLYGDIMDRPLSEILDQVCRDAGLNPDWTLLAHEGWAQEEIAGGAVGPRLAALQGQTPPPRPVPGPYWPDPNDEAPQGASP